MIFRYLSLAILIPFVLTLVGCTTEARGMQCLRGHDVINPYGHAEFLCDEYVPVESTIAPSAHCLPHRTP